MTVDLPSPDLAAIRSAQERIAGHVVRTPLVRSHALSAATGADVWLKHEIDQPTGSFKVRGACNAIRAAADRGAVAGVTTASTGNHARAVAYMGRRFSLPVRAYMSDTVSASRVRALHDLGAEVDTSCPDQTAAIVAAQEDAAAHGYAFIPPFDHPDVIAGQGTIGIELCDDVPDLDAAIVQVSGGGLIGGIGTAVKGLRPAARVIGVCAADAPAMAVSLAAGHPVGVPELPTVAASLMGDLGPDNRYTFRVAQRVVDEMGTVDDDAIAAAATLIRDREGLVVEPAAAAGVAWLLAAGERFRGRRVALVLTGNAVDRR